MRRARSARIVLPCTLMLCLVGCIGGSEGHSAAESKALVRQQAPEALATTVTAVSGTYLQGEGAWASCMAQPVWRYQGWARFSAPPGDRKAQLEAIRAALVQAGYQDTSQVEGKVTVERGRFVMVVAPIAYIRTGPPRWQASFHAEPCARYTAGEREAIKSGQYAPEPLVLPR